MQTTGGFIRTAVHSLHRALKLLPRLQHGLCALGLGLFLAAPAQAADEVDITVDAVVAVGSVAGVSVGPTETALIKAIVRCTIHNRPVLNCARNEIVLQLPQDARALVTCVLEGRPLEECGIAEVRRRLPPQAASVLDCIMQRTSIGQCGEGLVLNAAQRQAFAIIEKLKADGRSELEAAGAGAIRNIIAISEGIRADDWLKVAVHGGAEVYKAAAKIVLKAVLPAVIPAGLAIDPVIDALIQSRVDLVANIIKGAKARDVRIIGQALTEAYLMEGFMVPCSIPEIPPEVKEAICGNVGRIIHAFAEAAGDAAALLVRAIKDPLGFPDALWKKLEKIRGIIVGKKSDCVAPEQYYSANYAKCYHRGVVKRLSGPDQLRQLVGSLNQHCRGYYDRCFFSEHFDSLCNPQQAMFERQSNQLTSGVIGAANLYSNGFTEFARSKGTARVCQPQSFMGREYQEFLDQCAAALSVQFPLAGDPTRDDCDSGPKVFSRAAHRAVCEQAMARVNTASILRNLCEPPVPPPAPVGCSGEGRCGFLDVRCTVPFPAGTQYGLSGINGLKIVRIVPELGLLNAEYSVSSGNFTTRVCAQNAGGLACGEVINITLGSSIDRTCFGPPVPPKCPPGLRLCMNQCITRNQPCNMPK